MTRSRSQAVVGRLAPFLAATALLSAACGGEVDPPRAKAQAAPSSPSAAPSAPRAVAAAASPACAGTGAHDKHLGVGIACANCHPCAGQYGFDKPFTYPAGTTSAGGTITRAAGTPTTCSVGCHQPLGTLPHDIAWNTLGPLACTSCHSASSLADPHPTVSDAMTRADCQGCHDTSAHGGGTVTLVGHPLAWMDQTSTGFHAYAAERGLAACQQCHMQNLRGVANVPACNQCHRAGGTANDFASCTACHGTDNPGAPPRTIWGYGNDAVRVGAHTSHLTASDIAPAFDCGVCHAKPADLLAAGHIDDIAAGAVPTASVVFSGLAAGGVNPAPTWDRTTATCSSTYCHGATLREGTNTMPIWTLVGQGQGACGTCHGVPPITNHPAVSSSGGLAVCNPCHSGTIDAAGNMIPPSAGGKHLDGMVEASGHPASWMDQTSTGFHAYSVNRGIANCQSCHGAALSKCVQCHGTSWATSCTMCHGGTDNATGAPPRATWGSTSLVAVGAHNSHVGPNPVSGAFGCEECHTKPTDAFSLNHIEGTVSVSFAGPVSGLKGGSWNYPATGTPTCSSTYCHGNFTRGKTTNVPDWTGTNQAACGTCHPARPGSYLHLKHQGRYYANPSWPWWPPPGGSPWVTCDQCHFGIAASVDNAQPPTLTQANGGGPPLHVNGTPNVVFKFGGTYTIDPYLSQGNCSSMACHVGEGIKVWPR